MGKAATIDPDLIRELVSKDVEPRIRANQLPILDANGDFTGETYDRRLGPPAGQPDTKRLDLHLRYKKGQTGKDIALEIGQPIPGFDHIDPFESEGIFDSFSNMFAASLEGSLTGVFEKAVDSDDRANLFGLVDDERIKRWQPNALEQVLTPLVGFAQPLDIIALGVGGGLGGLAAKTVAKAGLVKGLTTIAAKEGVKVLAKGAVARSAAGAIKGGITFGTYDGARGFFDGLKKGGVTEAFKEGAMGFGKGLFLGGGVSGPAGAIPAKLFFAGKAGAALAGTARGGSEIFTLGTISPFLEGRTPTTEDYSNAAGFILAIKGLGTVTKLGSKAFGRNKLKIEADLKAAKGEAHAKLMEELNTVMHERPEAFERPILEAVNEANLGKVIGTVDSFLNDRNLRRKFREILDVEIRVSNEPPKGSLPEGEDAFGWIEQGKDGKVTINVNPDFKQEAGPTLLHEMFHLNHKAEGFKGFGAASEKAAEKGAELIAKGFRPELKQRQRGAAAKSASVFDKAISKKERAKAFDASPQGLREQLKKERIAAKKKAEATKPLVEPPSKQNKRGAAAKSAFVFEKEAGKEKGREAFQEGPQGLREQLKAERNAAKTPKKAAPVEPTKVVTKTKEQKAADVSARRTIENTIKKEGSVTIPLSEVKNVGRGMKQRLQDVIGGMTKKPESIVLLDDVALGLIGPKGSKKNFTIIDLSPTGSTEAHIEAIGRAKAFAESKNKNLFITKHSLTAKQLEALQAKGIIPKENISSSNLFKIETGPKTKPTPKASAKGKEPHEMTREEFVERGLTADSKSTQPVAIKMPDGSIKHTTFEEALANKEISKKRFDKGRFGGLSEKQHKQMLRSALEANYEFKVKQPTKTAPKLTKAQLEKGSVQAQLAKLRPLYTASKEKFKAAAVKHGLSVTKQGREARVSALSVEIEAAKAAHKAALDNSFAFEKANKEHFRKDRKLRKAAPESIKSQVKAIDLAVNNATADLHFLQQGWIIPREAPPSKGGAVFKTRPRTKENARLAKSAEEVSVTGAGSWARNVFERTKEIFSDVDEVATRVINKGAHPLTKEMFEAARQGTHEKRVLQNQLYTELQATGEFNKDMSNKAGIELGESIKAGTAPKVAALLSRIRDAVIAAGGKMGLIKPYFPGIMKEEIKNKLNDAVMGFRKLFPDIQNMSDERVMQAIKQKAKGARVSWHVKGFEGLPILETAVERIRKVKKDMSVAEVLELLEGEYSGQYVPTVSFIKERKLLELFPSWYETNAKIVLPEYINAMTKHIAELNAFGPNTERLVAAIEKVKDVNLAEAEMLERNMMKWSGLWDIKHGYRGLTRTLVDWFTALEVAAKIGLGFAPVKQFTQVGISAGPHTGAWNMIGGFIDGFDPVKRSIVAKTGLGAGLEGMGNDAVLAAAGRLPGGRAGDFARFTTKWSGFTFFNKVNLYWSALAFRRAAQQWTRQAQGTGKTATRAQKQLTRWGLDPKQPLTDKKMSRAMFDFANESQLLKDVFNEPEFLNNPKTRPLFLFKRFGLKQATLIGDMIRKDAIQNGNYMPLIRLSLNGFFGGAVLNWGINNLKEAIGGEPVLKQEDSITGKVIENFATVGALGVVSDVMSIDRLSRLGGAVKFAVAPVFLSDAEAFLNNYTKFMEDWERYGDGFTALKRNSHGVFDVWGSIPRLAAKRIHTDSQKDHRLRFKKGQTKRRILELMVEGNVQAASDRLADWNEKVKDDPIEYREVQTKIAIDAFIRRKAKTFAEASFPKGSVEAKKAERKRYKELKQLMRDNQ